MQGRPADVSDTAVIGDRFARGLRDLTDDPAALDSTGFWAVAITFEGRLRCARFDDVRAVPPQAPRAWSPIARSRWSSSLDRAGYLAAVRRLRGEIAAGEVYQVTLCRVLSAPSHADPWTLAEAVRRGNPAPYAAVLDLPGLRAVSASPERFLRRDGDLVCSQPIKGTAVDAAALRNEKEIAENVMIVDLVRNDLSRVAEAGSVDVPALCAVERHPGLVHLVSTVSARLRPGIGWADLLSTAFPPGSVTGAPKSSALRLITDCEPVPRGLYCGALGWVDADRTQGDLAVAIRTFWWDDDHLHFGTGAGITWGSDPDAEWAETQVKADRLLSIAAGESC